MSYYNQGINQYFPSKYQIIRNDFSRLVRFYFVIEVTSVIAEMLFPFFNVCIWYLNAVTVAC